MARFYMSSVNSRGNTVTAQGKSTGQDCHLRGWSAGVEVIAHPGFDDKDVDAFDIYMTTGSGGGGSRKLIGSVESTPSGPEFTPA